ncbi:flagellar biosynthetic protein FliP, partial [Pseudomonas syringae pv. tagetis]
HIILAQTRPSDLELIMRLSNRTDIPTPDDAPPTNLVPAFVISQLKTAYQNGLMIFNPILINDLVQPSEQKAMRINNISPLIIS